MLFSLHFSLPPLPFLGHCLSFHFSPLTSPREGIWASSRIWGGSKISCKVWRGTVAKCVAGGNADGRACNARGATTRPRSKPSPHQSGNLTFPESESICWCWKCTIWWAICWWLTTYSSLLSCREWPHGRFPWSVTSWCRSSMQSPCTCSRP